MDNQQPNNNLFYRKPQEGYGFIYKYTSPSNKNYIGQTINTLASRASNPISGIGYKKCTLFWKAIQKYSFTKFQIEILEEVPIQELNEKEIYYINKYNSLAPNGYNLTPGGQTGKTTEVFVYSAQNGKFLEHYNSVSEASLFTGVPIETISAILGTNNRRMAHNLVFTKQYIELFDINDLARDNYRKVYVYDENGDYIKDFISVSKASEELHIAECTIRRHLQSKTLTCGFYFRDFKSDKIDSVDKTPKKGKMVCQIDPNTYFTIATYSSLQLAAESVGLAQSRSITRAIKENRKAKGFYWRIVEGSTTTRSENPTETVRDTQMGEDIV